MRRDQNKRFHLWQCRCFTPVNSSDPSYDQEFNFSTEDLGLKTDTVAGFGRLTWAVTDTFRLTGGVRYTWEQKQGVGSYLTVNTICPGAFIPPPFGPQFCFEAWVR